MGAIKKVHCHARRDHQQKFLLGAHSWKQGNVELGSNLPVLLRSNMENNIQKKTDVEKVYQHD